MAYARNNVFVSIHTFELGIDQVEQVILVFVSVSDL